jgi:hypothetical protein
LRQQVLSQLHFSYKFTATSVTDISLFLNICTVMYKLKYEI